MRILFAICMILVFGKLFTLAIKAAWGLTKIMCNLVILPEVLIVMTINRLIYLALPIVVIIGIVMLVVGRK